MKTKGVIIVFLTLLTILFWSCNKKNKLTENVDPSAVNFLVNQPSISQASFIARCTNYDIILDTINFLTPNNLVYQQLFNSGFYYKNEEFGIGGYEATDGLWIIQFKGTIQGTSTTFSSSVPYDMNIQGDEEE